MATPAGPRPSLIARMRDAIIGACGPKTFVGGVLGVVCMSACCKFIEVILLSLLLPLHIAMIVVGALYLNDCPVEKFIPIFLVTGGTVGTVKDILNICKRRSENEEGTAQIGISCCTGILYTFMFGWFIAGCVWVFGNYQPDFDDPTSAKYCNKTLYNFAFGTLIASFALTGFMCLRECCMKACASCMVAD
ncbi:transmembrane protein 272-like [Ornithodoros turicata]|uniref:transmembrane protein 272-like n=1 Tax=Ornithodoros turicata TaxID=34597 RepID=UPI00313893C3